MFAQDIKQETVFAGVYTQSTPHAIIAERESVDLK
jgi:hypothetical protein